MHPGVAIFAALTVFLSVLPHSGGQDLVSQIQNADTEEKVRWAAEAVVAWAAADGRAEEEDVLAQLQRSDVDPVTTALRLGAVLDAAEAIAAKCGLETVRYESSVKSLSPLFTAVMDRQTTPYRYEAANHPKDLSSFEGLWYDSSLQEMLLIREGRCRVIIPYLDNYGERSCPMRLRDRSAEGYCPALEVDVRGEGTFFGPLVYYVSAVAEDHFTCNTQSQRFDRIAPA